MKVRNIMNKVYTIDRDLSLVDVAKILAREKVSSLVIIKKSKAIGIITEKDIVKNISHLKRKVSKVMSKTLITIGPNKTLEGAADLMHRKKIKRLLIVDTEELVGIITATDIIANADMFNKSFSLLG